MKTYNILKLMIIFLIAIFLNSGCDDTETDFGFSGQISGKILDPSGNIVPGDVTRNNLMVYLHGELDTQPMIIRVKGDGTYANTHLYPQSYTLSVVGAIMPIDDITVDLKGTPVVRDISVTPFLTIPLPGIVGSVTSNSVTVSYSITENEGKTCKSRIIFVSTVPFPSQSTGSGAWWQTVSKTVTQNEGQITITGLNSGKTYYVRIGALAVGTTMWNFSDQITFDTP